jgi:hypothetical protein
MNKTIQWISRYIELLTDTRLGEETEKTKLTKKYCRKPPYRTPKIILRFAVRNSNCPEEDENIALLTPLVKKEEMRQVFEEFGTMLSCGVLQPSISAKFWFFFNISINVIVMLLTDHNLTTEQADVEHTIFLEMQLYKAPCLPQTLAIEALSRGF